MELILINTVFASIFLSFSLYAFNNLSTRLIFNFALMTLSMFIFSFGYIYELFANSIDFVNSAVIIQYLGLASLSIFLVDFAYKFKYNRYPASSLIVFSSIIPFSSLFLVITNNMHHLYFKQIKLIPYGNHYLAIFSKGIFYYLFFINLYVSLGFCIYSLFCAYKRENSSVKKQSKLMLVGLVFPIIFSIPIFLNDPTFKPLTLSFLFVAYFSYKALFKYHFLDLKETIRNYYFDKISEGLFIIDNNKRIIDFNREASSLLPFLNQEDLGNPIYDYDLGKKIIAAENNDFFELNINIDDNNRIYEFRKTPISSKKKIVAHIYIISDITKTRSIISDLSHMANHDYLTGLHNRLSFLRLANSHINRLKMQDEGFSLIMIDIDYFKRVNDTYGHNVGDQVLRKMCTLIKNNLRKSDIFARLGGEEFCILLPEMPISDGKKICEKIRNLVETTPIIMDDLTLNITISLGMTYYNSDMSSAPIELIIDLADKALYRSKKLGRNRVIYNHFSLRY